MTDEAPDARQIADESNADGPPDAPRRADVLRASPKLFDSYLLDKLSRVHPAVPVVIFLPAILVLAVIAVERVGTAETLGLMVVGYFIWTLAEYWIHRSVFHFEPADGLGAKFHWIIHGVHHDHPNDPLRLVMPPSVSVPLALLFYGLFYVVLGPSRAPALAAGFYAGYLVYDMMHYALHHHVPKSRLGKRLRELHMRHHFQDDTGGFGISAPYWDHVFGTVAEGGREPARRGDDLPHHTV